MTRYIYLTLIFVSTLTLSANAQEAMEDLITPEIQAHCDANPKIYPNVYACYALQKTVDEEMVLKEAVDMRNELDRERQLRKAAERDMAAAEQEAAEAKRAAAESVTVTEPPAPTEERRSIYGTANFDHLVRDDEPVSEPTVVREILYVEREPAPQAPAPTYQAPMVMTPPPRGYTIQLGGASQTAKKAGMALECRNGTGMTIVAGGIMIPDRAVFTIFLNTPLQTGERFQLYYELVFQGLVIETKSHRILDQKYPSTAIVTLQ